MLGAVLAAALMAPSVQDTPPGGAADLTVTEFEAIVVEGRRLEEAARAYVEEIGEPPPGARPGRWNSEICISVSGMQPRFAQFMIDRIAIAALDVGVDVGEPGCRPNVIIMATNDGSGLASRLVDEVGLSFRPSLSGTNLGRRALDHFRSSDSPVRWWHVTMPVEPDSGQVAVALRGQGPATINVRDASRMRSNIRYDIAWAIIIVDMDRTGDASFGALSDYVALAALTQLDPFADLAGQETIANLFRANATVSGLTSWDRDYLTALYSSQTNRATPRQQINDIATRLTEERRDETDGAREEAPQDE